MNHKEIVAVVERHFSGGWWGQMVTVGYEQARGPRELNRAATASRPAATRRLTCPSPSCSTRGTSPAVPPEWLGDTTASSYPQGDQAQVAAHHVVRRPHQRRRQPFPQGRGKSYVSLQHTKLKDGKEVEKMKRYWGATLEKMKASLEG